MAATPMIAWTMVGSEPEAGADIAVYADGRVVLAVRFGAGPHRLSKPEVEALRRFVFEDQRLLDLDPERLQAAVGDAATERRLEAGTSAARAVTGAMMDAGTTVIRASDGERTREIRYHDLAGDAQTYQGVDALQRLRAVELRLLELAGQR